MKWKILLRVYGLPALWLVLAAITFLSAQEPFRAYARIVFFASVVFAILLSDRRYLQDATITDGQLTVTWLNHFLSSRTKAFPVSEITSLSIKGRRWGGILPASLEFKSERELMRFVILDDEILSHVERLRLNDHLL